MISRESTGDGRIKHMYKNHNELKREYRVDLCLFLSGLLVLAKGLCTSFTLLFVLFVSLEKTVVLHMNYSQLHKIYTYSN